jgi:hypothetical protein
VPKAAKAPKAKVPAKVAKGAHGGAPAKTHKSG